MKSALFSLIAIHIAKNIDIQQKTAQSSCGFEVDRCHGNVANHGFIFNTTTDFICSSSKQYQFGITKYDKKLSLCRSNNVIWSVDLGCDTKKRKQSNYNNAYTIYKAKLKRTGNLIFWSESSYYNSTSEELIVTKDLLWSSDDGANMMNPVIVLTNEGIVGISEEGVGVASVGVDVANFNWHVQVIEEPKPTPPSPTVIQNPYPDISDLIVPDEDPIDLNEITGGAPIGWTPPDDWLVPISVPTQPSLPSPPITPPSFTNPTTPSFPTISSPLPPSPPSFPTNPSPPTPSVQAEPFTMMIVGDTPYNRDELRILKDQIQDIPQDIEALFHVGDIMSRGGGSTCSMQDYSEVGTELINSHADVFIVPGDNDANDCDSFSQGFGHWKNTFLSTSFLNRWRSFNVEREVELFSFVHKSVLVVGINAVGGPPHSSYEWSQRHRRNVQWVNRQVSRHSYAKAIVIIGHARPTYRHEDMFKSMKQEMTRQGINMDRVIYVHGDGHAVDNYSVYGFRCIQVDKGTGRWLKLKVDVSLSNPFQTNHINLKGSLKTSEMKNRYSYDYPANE